MRISPCYSPWHAESADIWYVVLRTISSENTHNKVNFPNVLYIFRSDYTTYIKGKMILYMLNDDTFTYLYRGWAKVAHKLLPF